MKQWREKKTRNVSDVDFEGTLKPDLGGERYWVSSGALERCEVEKDVIRVHIQKIIPT